MSYTASAQKNEINSSSLLWRSLCRLLENGMNVTIHVILERKISREFDSRDSFNSSQNSADMPEFVGGFGGIRVSQVSQSARIPSGQCAAHKLLRAGLARREAIEK